MLDGSGGLGAFASDVEAGHGSGVAAGFDGEFFVAVEDPEVVSSMMTVTIFPAWRGPSLVD